MLRVNIYQNKTEIMELYVKIKKELYVKIKKKKKNPNLS